MEDKKIKNQELQKQLKNLENQVSEKLKPIVQLTQKIGEEKFKTSLEKIFVRSWHLISDINILCENKRAISTLKTDNYGDILISEIGATMVGSIIQSYQPNSQVEAGSEKGYFAFGGSTIILLFEKGKIHFSKDILKNTENGFETGVLMGETIGE